MTRMKSLADILAGGRGEAAAAAVLAVNRIWPEVVGSWIAERSRPIAFKKGVLTIGAESPALANELTFMAEEGGFVRKLNDALGRKIVTEIRFKTAAEPKTGARSAAAHRLPPPIRPVQPLDPAARAEAEAKLAHVEDPELREILLRLRLKARSESDGD